ncbi:zinc ABC transporter substrate-binding protein ZnuA [Thalassospira sp. ER-Se-21-Dark]|uniref:zinc ABC transporter substrate-binding protein ZnuA n=1 Tax=Thalassospira sp. ER-Se-21-Dark TaxID=2585190 RepID=UPI001B310728|nr:zinc ABC transporter substrate-binding protein ZnuA [Thalassospira sp. ER-Se-21-Dark]MBP3127993.1 zinc ABC transporter substrate-binding protein ZnuA [Thalassospira sp. ER-Se-21-Dark]
MPSLRRALRHILFTAPILVAAPLTAVAHGDDAPKVVTSIKPVHGITSAIMKDIGEPVLLIDGASSPHTYSLRPSEARALNDADLVIYVSHALEGFLEKPLESLSGHSHQLELVSLPQLSLRNMREGGTWEGHMHAHEGDAHDDHEDHDDHVDEHEKHDDDDAHHDAAEHHEHEGIDTHIWMDPANGATIAIAIADELAEIDPEHAEDYRANLETLLASLTNLGNDLREKVAPVQDKPYVVFHDAYQYLEAGFGLNAVGSITVSPDQKPGAKRLHEIEDKIHDTGAVCIFAEPQFRPAIVQAVVSDTGIRTGTLDPLGFDIAAGPTAYQEILAQNVDALVDCLGDAS